MTDNRALFSERQMHYETPSGGTTIGGYVARRLHKTILLRDVPSLIPAQPTEALAQLGLFAAAGSTSFGPALYRPDSDRRGDIIQTADPETGARISVTYRGGLSYSYRIEMDGVGVLSGEETINGTTVGLHGLAMPAPSVFDFTYADGSYTAHLAGTITSELAPRIGTWRIRGYGQLILKDNQGNRGKLVLDRSGEVSIMIVAPNGDKFERTERLV
jgi:hypothetical protein